MYLDLLTTGDIKTSGTGFFDKELQVGPYGNQVLIDVDQTLILLYPLFLLEKF